MKSILGTVSALALALALGGAAHAADINQTVNLNANGNTNPMVNLAGRIETGAIAGNAAQSSQSISGTGAVNQIGYSVTQTTGTTAPSLGVSALPNVNQNAASTATVQVVGTIGGSNSGISGGFGNSQTISALGAGNVVTAASTGLPVR